MEFAKVNFGLNQTYFVETSAFETVVKEAMAQHKEYNIEDIEVIMDQSLSNVKINLKLSTTKKTILYSETIPMIEKSINERVRNLINVRPTNVSIQVKVGK